ncbi:MAG: ABC transporter substrate-binding protein [Sporolactobacillus sp.]
MKKSYRSRLFCRLLVIVCSFVLLMGFATGCSQTSSGSSSHSSSSATSTSTHKRVITDSTGAKVTLPNKINKIADAWPAHNEIVAMLGSANKIVATIDAKSQYPWMYRVFPTMNKAKAIFTPTTVNTDSLAQMKPDLLFISTNPQLLSKTKELGIPTEQLIFQNYNDLQKVVNITAQTLGGQAPARAKRYNTYLTNRLQKIQNTTNKIPASQKPSVLHIETLKPLVIDGKGTIVDQWIKASGAKDAAGIAGNQRPASLEQVIKWNPDIIVIGRSGLSNPNNPTQSLNALYKDPQWSQINAVKNHKVLVNPMGVFLWDRYGMESALQFQWLAKELHPNQFKNLNMVTTTQQFYKNFLDYNLSTGEANKILHAENP